MSINVSQMTDVELRQMIGEIVEERLLVLLGDEEDKLLIKESLRKRLLEQMSEVKNGEHGEAFDDVVSRLGLN